MRTTIAKTWRVIAVMVSLLITGVPVAKFAADYLGKGYTIRWEEETDDLYGTERIGLHNSATAISNDLHLHVLFPGRELLDFESRGSFDGRPVSFLDTFRSADLPSGLNLLSTSTLSQIFDLHIKPQSVTAIRRVLRTNLESRIHALDERRGLGSLLSLHPVLLAQCISGGSPDCVEEHLIEEWEHQVDLMRSRVSGLWQQRTGGQVSFAEDSMGADGTIDFFLTLEPGHSAFLTLYFSKGMQDTSLQILPQELLGRVNKPDQLDESWLWIFAYQRPLPAFISLVCIGIGLALFVRTARPIAGMSRYQIVNLCLKTIGADNQEFWDLAFQKLQYRLLLRFSEISRAFLKPLLSAKAEELFLFCRDRLTIDHALHDLEFTSNEELDSAIDVYLTEWISKA